MWWWKRKKCKHDWEIIKEMWDPNEPFYYGIYVCLKCHKIVDQITPHKRRLAAEERKKKSRKEQAEEIYREYYRTH